MTKRTVDIINMVTGLSVIFNKEPSDQLIDLWILVFKDKDIDYAGTTKLAIENFDKMPTPKEILEFVGYKPKDLTAKNEAIEVLSAIKKTAKAYGYMNPKEGLASLSEREKATVYALGGWERVCAYDFGDSSKFAQAREIAETKVLVTEPEYKVLLGNQNEVQKKLDTESLFKNNWLEFPDPKS